MNWIKYLMLCLVVFVVACEVSTTSHFEIVDKKQGITGFEAPYVDITIENTSRGTGYDVKCMVSAKEIDSEKVISTGVAYFSSGGHIRPGQKSAARAVFMELQTSPFRLANLTLSYELTWIDL